MKRVMRNKNVFFFVFCMLLFEIAPINVCASDYSYRPGLKSWMSSPEMIGPSKGRLSAKGYDVNSIEEIKRATTDSDPLTRVGALHLLAYRIGRESIPNLKNALNDSYPYVRCNAARLLGLLDDWSGLEVMRRDMVEFTKDDWEKEQTEKDSGTSQKDMQLSLRTKGGRLLHALQAAQVLAEFGDVSGYKLAAKTVIEDKSGFKRIVAIAILTEIGRLDEAKLKAKGCEPEAILISVAENETNQNVLESLIACVRTNMRPESTIRILEKLQSSPYLTDKQKQRLQTGLKTTRKLLEKEKQDRTENKK